MNKIEEIITEIDGKLGYADATGNTKSKLELLRARNILKAALSEDNLCDSCVNCFELCGNKPTTMIGGNVISCRGHRKSGEANEI